MSIQTPQHPRYGAHRKTFTGMKTGWVDLVLGIPVCIGILALPWVGHQYLASRMGMYWLALFLPALAGLYGLYMFIGRLVRRLEVYEHGFVYRDFLRGGEAAFSDAVAWSVSITHSYRESFDYKSGGFRVELGDGRVIRIDAEFENDEELGSMMGGALVEPVTGSILNRLRQGLEVDCGPIRLLPDGIRRKKAVILWDDVERISEETKSTSFGDDRIRTVKLRIVGTARGKKGEGASTIEVEAGLVRNRPFLKAIIGAMRTPKPVVPKKAPLRLNGEVMELTEPVEVRLAKAMASDLKGAWSQALLRAELSAPGDAYPSMVLLRDLKSNTTVHCGAELMSEIVALFALHNRFQTGATTVEVELERLADDELGWSVAMGTHVIEPMGAAPDPEDEELRALLNSPEIQDAKTWFD
jgi:hypothetical protein